MCLPGFSISMAGTRYHIIHYSSEGEQLIGFIAFLAATHLVPPWLQPPCSVWAVPLLPPVTSGTSAKLCRAKPYGLSFTKDMTWKVIFADPGDAFVNIPFPLSGFSHGVHYECRYPSFGCWSISLFGIVMCLFYIFQILLGIFFILVALLFTVALFISK